MYIFERRINYYETDKMGVVHHSNYIRYFEEARCKFLEDNDLPYDKLESNGIISPVLGISCNYKKHITYGDIIQINCCITKFSGVKFTVAYEIYNKNTGTLCATGETNHCFTDNSLKPINMKKHHKEIFEKFMSLVAN